MEPREKLVNFDIITTYVYIAGFLMHSWNISFFFVLKSI